MTASSKIRIGVVALIAGLMLLPVVVHYRARGRVAAYRRELEAQGDKTTIADSTPQPTADALDHGQAVLSAALRLGRLSTNDPPLMKNIGGGKALVGWAQNELPWIFGGKVRTDVTMVYTTNVWPGAVQDISDRRETLAEARAALKNSKFSFNLDYSQGYRLLLPHLAPVKTTANWLAMATVTELHQNDLSNALENVKTCIAAGKVFESEPLQISQLVRVAIGQIALAATWETLQYPGCQEAQLKALQAEWQSLDTMSGIEPSIKMEMGLISDAIAEARTSLSTAAAMGSLQGQSVMDSLGRVLMNPKDGYEALMNGYPRYVAWKWFGSYEEELYDLQSWEAALKAWRRVQSGEAFAPAIKKLDEEFTQLHQLHPNGGERFILGLNDDTIHRYLLRLGDFEMERRLVVTAIALQRYRLRTGKFPGELKELTPDYLSQLPNDFMDGKPLRYQVKPDGFQLYSVGEDGVDHGGDSTPTESPDFGNKVWWRGKDAVWPMPATAEEAAAYKQETIAEWAKKNPATAAVASPRPKPQAVQGTNTN